jgi:hypothetical protein
MVFNKVQNSGSESEFDMVFLLSCAFSQADPDRGLSRQHTPSELVVEEPNGIDDNPTLPIDTASREEVS